MDLIEALKRESSIEKKQKISGSFIPDLEDIDSTSTITPTLRSEFFFKNKDIFISKHNRFAAYPEHSHEFLEFNYQLNGTSKQIINGETHTLSKGDLLLLDTGSTHSIDKLGEEDILLNILFSNKMISLNWLREMNITDSILYKILLTTNSIDNNTTNFLIFRDEGNVHLQKILLQMVREYIFPQIFSNKIISSYLPILLYELSRKYPVNYDLDKSVAENPFIKILEIIDTEYDVITLKELAERLNYNKNYLSNLIKEKSGSTFTELLNEKKLMKAKLLIQSTEMPINMIATDVGFSNKTYFYKKYKEHFGNLPSKERQNTI